MLTYNNLLMLLLSGVEVWEVCDDRRGVNDVSDVAVVAIVAVVLSSNTSTMTGIADLLGVHGEVTHLEILKSVYIRATATNSCRLFVRENSISTYLSKSLVGVFLVQKSGLVWEGADNSKLVGLLAVSLQYKSSLQTNCINFWRLNR